MPSKRRRARPETTTQGHPLEIRPVYHGERFFVRTLSGPHQGLLVHWARSSIYCSGDSCPPAVHRLSLSWRGYEPVEEWDAASKLWLPCILEVTEHLELEFRGRYCRGQVWELWRMPKEGKGNKPVEGKLIGKEDDSQWPAAFPMTDVLGNFYRTPVALDTPNPRAARVLIAPSQGPAPGAGPAAAPAPPAERSPIHGRMAEEFRRRQHSEGNGQQN